MVSCNSKIKKKTPSILVFVFYQCFYSIKIVLLAIIFSKLVSGNFQFIVQSPEAMQIKKLDKCIQLVGSYGYLALHCVFLECYIINWHLKQYKQSCISVQFQSIMFQAANQVYNNIQKYIIYINVITITIYFHKINFFQSRKDKTVKAQQQIWMLLYRLIQAYSQGMNLVCEKLCQLQCTDLNLSQFLQVKLEQNN
eukprot:TRINITY_DN22121_c0_g1_i1.p4 TRINITY_DN22121_c0_g1~~TRINITY_DN22121_c0_g1_i1.p4  ORF type:complete len:196 (+),score=-18.84 TRINITY_DN22121_c0_g1_i1:223-810(+)